MPDPIEPVESAAGIPITNGKPGADPDELKRSKRKSRRMGRGVKRMKARRSTRR